MNKINEITTEVNFRKQSYYISIDENDKIANIYPSEFEGVEYLDEKGFEITPIIDYDFIGYKINGGELISVDGNHFTISNVTENIWIELITKPTEYSIENNIKDNNYNFKVDKDFSKINTVKLCSNNNCKSLKTSDYSVNNKTISINNTFINSMEEGDYELQVTFANEEEATTYFRLTHTKEIPIINSNPKTNSNILLLVIGIFLFVLIKFKNEREDS